MALCSDAVSAVSSVNSFPGTPTCAEMQQNITLGGESREQKVGHLHKGCSFYIYSVLPGGTCGSPNK